MARMGVSKDSLEGVKVIAAGFYDFRLDGFAPKKAKKGDTTNFNPRAKIINNANGLNDTPLFISLNSSAGWIQKDFVHSLGLTMDIEGEMAFMPGDWGPDPDNPKYEGPMVGRTGRLEYAIRKDDKNRDQNYVKSFICAVQGCQDKHSTDLK
jgi:hypothetical protein